MGVNPGEMNGFEHINSALPNWDTPYGVHVKNKNQYEKIMKENRFISYEQQSERCKDNGRRPHEVSEDAKKILYLINRDKKNGKVKMSSELIYLMKKIGAIRDYKIPPYITLPA